MGPPGVAPGWPHPSGLVAAPNGPPPRGRATGWLAGLALVAVGVLVAVGLVVLGADDGAGSEATVADEVSSLAGTHASSTSAEPAPRPSTTTPPTPPTDPLARQAPEPTIPTASGPHIYLSLETDGDPVTWDPCDPIRFVVNDLLAPPGAAEVLAEAMARVTAATGLVFVDEGVTDEPPAQGSSRPREDPARYGEGWSPVLISWTDAAAVPGLEGYAGLTQPLSVFSDVGEAIYVTGYIELDRHYAANAISWGDRQYLVSLVMHELGHLVGLGHVREVTEVMTDDPEGVNALDWGPGDRFGLATVGRGECDPDI
ncbi:MAG TPA: hypothetical protein VK507_03965 [Iamia sp.]|nr:hypothetical protein [Iamia sp.]